MTAGAFADRGTGWVDGPTPTRALLDESHRLIGLSAGDLRARPTTGGCERPLWVTDQGSEESCTDHAGTGCVYELTGFRGCPGVSWWFGRAYDLGFGDEPPQTVELPNVGVSLRGFQRALERHGIAAGGRWGPGSPGYSPHRIPPALARLGAQRHNLHLQPLYSTGRAVVEALVDHLLTKRPAILVVRADDAYRNPGAGGIVGPARGAGGLHAVRVRRYRRDGDRYQFLSPGSWGPFFGARGEVWLDETRVSASPAPLLLATGVS